MRTLHLDALAGLDPAAVWPDTVWIAHARILEYQLPRTPVRLSLIHCLGAVVLTLKATGCVFWLLMLNVRLTSCVKGPAIQLSALARRVASHMPAHGESQAGRWG